MYTGQHPDGVEKSAGQRYSWQGRRHQGQTYPLDHNHRHEGIMIHPVGARWRRTKWRPHTASASAFTAQLTPTTAGLFLATLAAAATESRVLAAHHSQV